MKRFVFVLVFCLAAMVPRLTHATIDIDISNSQIEIVDSHSIKLRNVIAHGYPGTYWVLFRWDQNNLVFVPVDGGPETTSGGAGNRWTITYDYGYGPLLEITISIAPSNRIIFVSFRALRGEVPIDLDILISIRQGGNRFRVARASPMFECFPSYMNLATFFGDNNWSGFELLPVGITRSGQIRCIPSWFDFNQPFIFYWNERPYQLQ